tara:strand:+ start:87 stop:1208 length:1122 start_codon:yes stop_codon:yes gene_type:complete
VPLSFRIQARDGKARRGTIETPHGCFDTPAFMTVGTRATVKALTPDQLREAQAQVLLANTYHLMLRPGESIIEKMGGLHSFMNWNGPILTDSGGFQIFSLGNLVDIGDEGVVFTSHYDGSRHAVSPHRAMEIQRALGADMVMAFDQCSDYPFEYDQSRACVERTLRWARACKEVPLKPHQTLLGIVQGSTYEDLRAEATERLIEMDFEAYAIGGLAVGEPRDEFQRILAHGAPLLPDDRPRYLMGVGPPSDLFFAIAQGVDMFDCVIPTRHARNNQAFTWQGRKNLRNAIYTEDPGPLDPDCQCSTCQHFSRAYLSHLVRAREMLGATLLSLHNVHFFQDLMQRTRQAIEESRFESFTRSVIERMQSESKRAP